MLTLLAYLLQWILVSPPPADRPVYDRLCDMIRQRIEGQTALEALEELCARAGIDTWMDDAAATRLEQTRLPAAASQLHAAHSASAPAAGERIIDVLDRVLRNANCDCLILSDRIAIVEHVGGPGIWVAADRARRGIGLVGETAHKPIAGVSAARDTAEQKWRWDGRPESLDSLVAEIQRRGYTIGPSGATLPALGRTELSRLLQDAEAEGKARDVLEAARLLHGLEGG